MWHLIPAILCLTFAQAYLKVPLSLNNPYPAVYMNNERNPAPNYYPGLVGTQKVYSYNVPAKQYPEYSFATAPPYYQTYSGHRQLQYNVDPYSNVSPYNKIGQGAYGIYYPVNPINNLRQAQKSNLFRADINPFDVDYVSDTEGDDPKSVSEGQSYYDDLELIENFGNYLRRRTQLDGSSTALNDPAHQYNALLAVIIALARVLRNSCTDLDQVYEQAYLSTVDTFYKYGLTNAEKVSGMIEDYIRKGNSHISRIKKLKQDICEKELFCSVSVDSKIKSSMLLYVKELETLEALSHLARSYYPYIEEFNQAAQKGAVLPYLQNSKDRLKDYVMHVVNSVEHLTDKAVKCP